MTDLALYRACLSALETLDSVPPQSRVGHLIGELRERVERLALQVNAEPTAGADE